MDSLQPRSHHLRKVGGRAAVSVPILQMGKTEAHTCTACAQCRAWLSEAVQGQLGPVV